MRYILLIVAMSFLGNAWSKDTQGIIPPAPDKAERPDKPQRQQSISIQPASMINPTMGDKLEIESEQNNTERHEEPIKWSEWLIALFTGLLVVVTGYLVCYTKKLWGSTKDLVERSEESTKIIERAYVKMSHTEPGITWFENDGAFLLEMKVENFGNTPADVTDVLLRPIVLDAGEPLPETPPYNRARIEKSFHTFLVKQDYFLYRNPELLTIDIETVSRVKSEQKILYVFGYVDYIDKFGKPHRSGYARRYNPRANSQFNENNLVFVNQTGYNYDHSRKNGEGL